MKLDELFIEPWGLLGLISVPIIIIIYLIKSKYVQKPVASTFIWKRSLQYVKRKIPMSIILSLLLILQILTAITASLAIARPLVKPLKSNEMILVLDASASMQSVHEGVSRFDLAKEEILELASGAGANSQVTVIYAGPTTKDTQIVVERTEKYTDVKNKLDDLKCAYGTADIDHALKLASGIQGQNAGATIKLITDKDYITVEGLEVVNIAKERVNEANASILSVTENPLLTGDYEFIAEVISYGFSGEYAIGIYVDDVFVASKNIKLPNASMADSDKPVKVIFTPNRLVLEGEENEESGTKDEYVIYIDGISSYNEVRVEIVSEDGIEVDNVYHLYPEVKNEPKILFVSSKFKTDVTGKVDVSTPTLLYLALSRTGYSIPTENLYASIEAVPKFEGYDLYIFESVECPEGEDFPTDGAVWLFNPLTVHEDIGVTIDHDNKVMDNFKMLVSSAGYQEAYQIISNNLKDAVVGIGRYSPMIIPPTSELEKVFALEGTNAPLLVAGTTNIKHAENSSSVRTVVSCFDFNDTSLPIMVGEYILLLNNLLTYSIPDVLTERNYEIGTTVQFNAPTGAEKLTVKYEDITIDEVNLLYTTVVLEKLGVYEVEVQFADGTTKSYMMPTHIPNEESNIAIIGERVEADAIPVGTVVEAEPVDIFPYLIALLILLLVTEWGVYHRDGV